jgi:hypothetical protein
MTSFDRPDVSQSQQGTEVACAETNSDRTKMMEILLIIASPLVPDYFQLILDGFFLCLGSLLVDLVGVVRTVRRKATEVTEQNNVGAHGES